VAAIISKKKKKKKSTRQWWNAILPSAGANKRKPTPEKNKEQRFG